MKSDYFSILKDAFRFTWRYKILWVFGLLLIFFDSGMSFNTNNRSFTRNSNNFSSSGSTEKITESLESVQKNIETYLSEPSNLILVVSIAIIVGIVFLLILSWYLRSVGRTSITRAYLMEREGIEENIRLGFLWKESHDFLKPVLIYDVLWLIPYLILGLFVSLSYVGYTTLFSSVDITNTLPLLVCLLFPIFFVASLLVYWSNLTGFRLLVIYGETPVQSFKKAVGLVKQNILDYILGGIAHWVVTLLYGLMIGVIFIIFVLIALFALIFPLISGTDPSGFSLLPVIAVGFLIILTFILVLSMPVRVFSEVYWTKFTMGVIERR